MRFNGTVTEMAFVMRCKWCTLTLLQTVPWNYFLRRSSERNEEIRINNTRGKILLHIDQIVLVILLMQT